MMLKICLTYDYELFMGRNLDTPDNILFNPTQMLKDILLKNGVKGTFFADVCSAIVYRQQKMPEYSDKFDKQLQDLISAGMDVQLHIHSSWLKAKNVNGELILNQDGYMIHEFGFDESKPWSVQKIICETAEYLRNVCSKANPDYKCIAYRAGGFGIQPIEKLGQVLLDNGIVIDSSVAQYIHVSKEENVNYYDFRNIPSKGNWYFKPESGIFSPTDSGIFEVPIASERPRISEKILLSQKNRWLPPAQPKGEFVQYDNSPKVLPRKTISQKIFSRLDYRICTLDHRTYRSLFTDMKKLYRKSGAMKQDIYLCLICHPKMLDRARLNNIEKLIQQVKQNPDKFQFVTFRDIYDDIFENI